MRGFTPPAGYVGRGEAGARLGCSSQQVGTLIARNEVEAQYDPAHGCWWVAEASLTPQAAACAALRAQSHHDDGNEQWRKPA